MQNLAHFVLMIELLFTMLSKFEREVATKDSAFWWLVYLTHFMICMYIDNEFKCLGLARLFNCFNFILNLWEGSKYVSSFENSEFWIFVNFCQYGRVLNMRPDAIMQKFWIFQDSEYARFLYMQALHKVLNMAEKNAPWQGSECAWSTFYSV